MKKFALFLLILVALGGVVFFFGWVQLQVPPGSVGIIRSKTHGLDPRPVQEGEFRWIWYRLIPTNTQVTIFRPDLTEKSIRISGTLPSGELYSTFAGLDEDFSYAVSGALTFSIKVDALPGLMERQYITNQEDLDAFGQRLADEITGLVNRRLLSMEPDTLETMLETGSTGALTDEIGRTYTDIENLSLHLGTVKFPDFALYISMRDLYREYLKFQQEILSAAAAGNAERHINSRLRLDELAQYGELLTKYPLLLDYLRLGLD